MPFQQAHANNLAAKEAPRFGKMLRVVPHDNASWNHAGQGVDRMGLDCGLICRGILGQRRTLMIGVAQRMCGNATPDMAEDEATNRH